MRANLSFVAKGASMLGSWTVIGLYVLVALVAVYMTIVMLAVAIFGDRALTPGTNLISVIEVWTAALPVYTVVLVVLMKLIAGDRWAQPIAYLHLPFAAVALVSAIVANVPWLQVAEFLAFAVICAGAAAYRMPQTDKTRALSSSSGDVDDDGEENDGILFPAERPAVSFKHIVGMADVKSRLLEAGHEIVGSQKQTGNGRNGMLLFGEPGNGKTFFAEALAGELELPIMTVTFGDVTSRYINQTSEQVKRAFADAHAQAPCVLFLDEIDSLIKDRYAGNSTSDEGPKTTNVLLTELVRARKSRIVVIAATNHLDKLDQAAIREGRFDFKVEITPPDEPARRGLIEHAIKPHRGVLEALPEAVDMAAKRWAGFSVARIRAVVDEAIRTGLKDDVIMLVYSDFQAALRTIQGRKGALPADALDLSELTLPSEMRKRLDGIASRMRNIEEVEARGGKVPTGLLFYGPPGTGKTAVARALAKSSGWAFIAVSGNELLGKPERIDEIVKESRDLRPAIVFIDEADDVLADRRYARHSASITNRLLTAMDGAGGKVHDIVWIAATNHPDQLDPAAVRGGRFGTKIEFDLPDVKTIAFFVKSWKEKSSAVFAKSVTEVKVARALEGLSIANVAAVLQEAADLMVERALDSGSDDEAVQYEDIIQAREAIAGDLA